MKRHFTVVAILLSLVGVALLIPGFSTIPTAAVAESDRDASRPAASSAVLSTDPEGSASSARVSAIPLIRLEVIDADENTPVESVAVFNFEGDVVRTDRDDALGMTNDSGCVGFEVTRLGAGGALLLHKRGYASETIKVAGGSSPYVVKLSRVGRSRVWVKTVDGRAVEDFMILVSNVEAAKLASGLTDQAAMMKDECGRRVRGFLGKSAADGSVVFDTLPKGRYYLDMNVACQPYRVHQLSAHVYADVPGDDKTVVVEEFLASVVSFVGDEVNHVSIGSVNKQPFAILSNTIDIEAQRQTTHRLREKLGVDHCFVGTLRPGKATSLPIMVHGRRSGWSSHQIPIAKVSDVMASGSATRITLMDNGTDHSGTLMLRVRSAGDDATSRLMGCRVLVTGRFWSNEYSMPCAIGMPVQVPAGSLRVVASADLPRGCFPTKAVEVEGGERVEVTLEAQGRIESYGLAVRLGQGREPRGFGLSSMGEGEDAGGAFTNVIGGEHRFLSMRTEQPVTVFAKGFRPVKTTLLPMAHAGDGQTLQVVTLTELK